MNTSQADNDLCEQLYSTDPFLDCETDTTDLELVGQELKWAAEYEAHCTAKD